MEAPVVLVVDDEKGVRDTIINFLKDRYDCIFREAATGKEAMRYIKSEPCDIVILDIKMPKESGIRVIAEAKEVKPDVDIFLVSGYITETVAEEAMKLGATDYMIKPINLQKLSLKFENILNKRSQKIKKNI